MCAEYAAEMEVAALVAMVNHSRVLSSTPAANAGHLLRCITNGLHSATHLFTGILSRFSIVHFSHRKQRWPTLTAAATAFVLCPLQACTGCDGVRNSPLRLDCAGVCGGGGLACPAVLAAAAGGLACPIGLALDTCGACTAVGSARNSSCAGCDGVPYSMAKVCTALSRASLALFPQPLDILPILVSRITNQLISLKCQSCCNLAIACAAGKVANAICAPVCSTTLAGCAMGTDEAVCPGSRTRSHHAARSRAATTTSVAWCVANVIAKSGIRDGCRKAAVH